MKVFSDIEMTPQYAPDQLMIAGLAPRAPYGAAIK